MFTGIIESLAQVKEKTETGTNVNFKIEASITPELKVDQSVAHNGVCLTVTNIEGNHYWVTAVEETLNKTNLHSLDQGSLVNLERCMKADGRYDGHMVYGHVDTVGKCIEAKKLDGSYLFTFEFDSENSHLIVEKGSISINGISLTIFNVTKNQFTVTIIPYTFEHTNIKEIKEGDLVNLEFDIIGKYINRKLLLSQE